MHDDEDSHVDTKNVRMEGEGDSVIWVGRPSQWVNMPAIIFYSLLAFGIVIGRSYILNSEYVWEYRQYIHYLDYVCIAVLSLLVLKALYKVLSIYYTKYELTNERLIEFTGITSVFQNGEPLELYNIYDYQFPQPLLLAFCRRGSLRLLTHDANQPEVYLYAIKRRREVYEAIRVRVEELRQSKKAYFNDPN